MHIFQTASSIISFLATIQSPRMDEYRGACDAKFELSTMFKTPSELALLRKKGMAGEVVGGDAEQPEVV